MTIPSNKTCPGSGPVKAPDHNGYDPSSPEESFDTIALLNAEGIVTSVTPSFTSILGYTPEELVGRSMLALAHPDDFDALQQGLTAIQPVPGKSLSATYRLLHKDGIVRRMTVHTANLLQVPQIRAIIAHFRDTSIPAELVLHRHTSEIDAPEHFVQFYETDTFLLDALYRFIETGLRADESCIVVATQDHLVGLEERLRAGDFDPVALHTRGLYTALDAGETLRKFMVEGRPDPARFATVIGDLIIRAARQQHRVRIFGEMVALLWSQGNQQAAIDLEALWNELHATTPFLLFCAYSLHEFAGNGYRVPFTEIRAQHSHVLPAESYALLTNNTERLHTITLLQQQAASLQAEIDERKETEQQLRVSENRYRHLFEASTDGILMVDPLTGTITEANPFSLELLDRPREQLLGQPLWKPGLFHDREATLEVLQALQEQHVVRSEALSLPTKNGQRRYIEFIGVLYPVNEHQVIQCNLRDITDRKRAEEARLLLAAIVESSGDAILSKDLDGIITSWNAAAEHMYGYSAQEIVGQSVTILFLPDRLYEHTQIMEHIRRGERIEHYETIRVRKDDRRLNVSVTISPIKDHAGAIIGASAIARDITEQKRLEAKFRKLFDSNLIGVFISDFAGTFLDANDAFLQLLGYTRADLQAGGLQRDALTPPEFHALSQDAVKALQEKGATGTYEKEYLHKSGKRIPILVAASRIQDTNTCIGFVLDITERKELEKRKDEFIGMASHELKTPVTSLKGFLGLLQRLSITQEDEKARYYLARMDAQVNKLTRLINDLLDISKIQTGQLAYRKERFQIDMLVQEIMENVQETTRTHRLQLEGQTHAEVFGDRDRIGQVLTNLLNNAIKYSPKADRVLVRIVAEHNRLVVSVQDFGIGIVREHHHKIFERFYQINNPEEKSYPGLGIGLYICSEIVRRHGGHMWVESEIGKGSTFHMALPLIEEEQQSDASPRDKSGETHQNGESAEKNPRSR